MSKQSETITFIPIEKLIPFRDHPFQIRDDEQMKMITESIRSVGVLVPAIARSLPDGTYELISGHWRKEHQRFMVEFGEFLLGLICYKDMVRKKWNALNDTLSE